MVGLAARSTQPSLNDSALNLPYPSDGGTVFSHRKDIVKKGIVKKGSKKNKRAGCSIEHVESRFAALGVSSSGMASASQIQTDLISQFGRLGLTNNGEWIRHARNRTHKKCTDIRL